MPNVGPAPRYLEAWDRSTSSGVTAQMMAEKGGCWIGPTLRLGEPFAMSKPEEIVKCLLARRLNPSVKILLTCRFDLVGPWAPAVGWANSFEPDWIATVPWEAQRDGLALMAAQKNEGLPLREIHNGEHDWGWWGKVIQGVRPFSRHPCFEYTGYDNQTSRVLVRNYVFCRTTDAGFRKWAIQQIEEAMDILEADFIYQSAALNMVTNPQGKAPPYPGHGMITTSPYEPEEAMDGMELFVQELFDRDRHVAIRTIGYANMGENLWSLYPPSMQDQLIAEIRFLRP